MTGERLEFTGTLIYADLPEQCIKDCGAKGDVTDTVKEWRETIGFEFAPKLRGRIIESLLDIGAWSRADLGKLSNDELAGMILWLACSHFNDWDGEPYSVTGGDVFTVY